MTFYLYHFILMREKTFFSFLISFTMLLQSARSPSCITNVCYDRGNEISFFYSFFSPFYFASDFCETFDLIFFNFLLLFCDSKADY